MKINQSKIEFHNLRLITLFKHVSNEELEVLAKRLQTRVLNDGETLYRPGQRLSGIYFITSGVLKQYKIGVKNKEQIYQLLKYGEMVGFDSALNQIPATEFTTCIEKARLIFVPIQIVNQLFVENQQVRIMLLQLSCRELGNAQNTIINISQKSNRQRIIELILDLRDRFNIDKDNMINISMKRLELAGHIGANEENVIRIISDLRKKRVVQTKGRKIGILQMDKLRQNLL